MLFSICISDRLLTHAADAVAVGTGSTGGPSPSRALRSGKKQRYQFGNQSCEASVANLIINLRS